MGGSIPQIVMYLVAGGVLGTLVGLLVGARISRRRVRELADSGKARLAELTHQKTHIASELAKSRSNNKSVKIAAAEDRKKLRSVRRKAKILAANVITLRKEREDTKIKINTLHQSFEAVKQQTLALQREFEKAGTFYKGELVKSFEKRKALEKELESARVEQEEFTKRVEASVLEHGSPEEMITAAQLRLGQLEVLERNVNKLETENARLRDEAKRMKQDYEALEQDLSELDELKIHNQQLVRCVESLENSRQQHEHEAERFRDQANESEQLSETLRLKLDDLQKNFADIEQQQQQAIKQVRKSAVASAAGTESSSAQDDGDSTDVVDMAQYSKRR